MDSQFDVFISYNWKDKEAVVRIAEKLRGRGLDVWLDDWQIRPGSSIPRSIDEGVRSSRSLAVFIGPDDVGPFQDAEIQAIIMEQASRGIPAISVLLPGASQDSIKKLPLLLTRNRWIDFSAGVESEDTLYLLHWGITGKRPPPSHPLAGDSLVSAPDAPAPAEEYGPVEDALKKLSAQLKTQNVTYFLGPGAAVGSVPMPSQGCDIARGLLYDVEIIGKDYKGLLPPVGVARMYYSVKEGERNLEERLKNSLCEAQKAKKPSKFPPAHDQLAELLKLLPSRPTPRGGSKVPQLVITTNLDLMMERALLRAGLSFTRIVQYRSGEQINVDQYRHVQLNGNGTVQLPPATAGGEPLLARVNDIDELNAVIKVRRKEDEELSKRPLDSIPWHEMPEPILYKFLGSGEVANSCVLSTSHHFNFPRRVLQRNSIPAYITDIIANSTTLFLGPWFTDEDFLLTYYALLCDPFKLSNDKRYAVQLHPRKFPVDVYRQQDSRVWEELKENVFMEMGIKTVEMDVAQFLRGLCARL